jgi:hypothetical protein
MKTIDNKDIIPEFFIKEEQRFEEHLKPKSNTKIVFSGNFGMGKTTFLNDYFFSKENLNYKGKRDHFNVFKVNPVNYSVSSNEDIFQLIKIEILQQFLDRGIITETKTVNTSNVIASMLTNNTGEIVGKTSELLLKVGAPVLDIYTKINGITALEGVSSSKVLNSVVDSVKSYTKDIGVLYDKEKKDRETYFEQVVEFIEPYKNDKEGILESDVTTSIIKMFLADQKVFKKETENILIVDDLDRLDPAHMFRILNVFASHIDNHSFSQNIGENKFGFDKVILVCDVPNLKLIFQHVYGDNTDFEGYFDKFYSSSTFEFFNLNEVMMYILHDFKSMLKVIDRPDAPEKYLYGLRSCLCLMIKQRLLNVRTLLKYKSDNVYKINIRTYDDNNGIKERNDDNFGLFFIDVLVSIYGDYSKLKHALNSMDTNDGLNKVFTEIYASVLHCSQAGEATPISLLSKGGNQGLYIFSENNFDLRKIDFVRVHSGNEPDGKNLLINLLDVLIQNDYF